MLEDLGGMPLVEFVYRRCRTSAKADEVAVLTSDRPSDDPLADHCASRSIPLFRGDLDDVLRRYVDGARHFGADMVARVCGDSPFVDTALLDAMLTRFQPKGAGRLDYQAAADCLNGFVSETVSLEALERSLALADDPDCLEHVTLFIRRNPDLFHGTEIRAGLRPPGLERFTLTVDHPADLDLARSVVAAGLPLFSFTSQEVIQRLRTIAAMGPSDTDSRSQA
jgi:spore coat polysaccharide biosynthesis protein SpsF (cytidylyltransferase family)